MITCLVCKTDKDPTEFNWRNQKRGWRKNYCRECDRAIKKRHYQRNRKELIAQSINKTKERRERFQKWKETLCCSICGEGEAACLDFHHLDPTQKDFGMSSASPNLNWNRLMEEVQKCIVVCKNCHAKVHKYGLETVKSNAGVV